MEDGMGHACWRPSWKRHRMESNSHRWLWCVYDAPVFQGGCHCSLELHKSRPAKPGSPNRLPPDPLTHSSPRPDKREKRREDKNWKKRMEQHRSSLLVLELLAFFRAGAFFQAHIIQSNLPSVTTPFFTFEDDALDVSPSQGDLCLPPAVATISSPQGCSVGTVFSHKHLECARVQPRHLVPER